LDVEPRVSLIKRFRNVSKTAPAHQAMERPVRLQRVSATDYTDILDYRDGKIADPTRRLVVRAE